MYVDNFYFVKLPNDFISEVSYIMCMSEIHTNSHQKPGLKQGNCLHHKYQSNSQSKRNLEECIFLKLVLSGIKTEISSCTVQAVERLRSDKETDKNILTQSV